MHQACVENCVSSHEDTIKVLVLYHQLNLFQVSKSTTSSLEVSWKLVIYHIRHIGFFALGMGMPAGY